MSPGRAPTWTICFDADDTLWHNARFFALTAARFAELLADHAEVADLETQVLAVERRNLARYGFGIKGYTLSLIETALEVTEGAVPGRVIAQIVEMGREMLAHPVELLPHARATVEALAGRHRIVLVTKGDLLHQERKLAASGLGCMFDAVEIVSDKTRDVYARIFAANPTDRHMMIGNSMKSDVLPAIAAGGWGVFVPHGDPWAIEHADPPADGTRYRALPDLSDVPQLPESLP